MSTYKTKIYRFTPFVGQIARPTALVNVNEFMFTNDAPSLI